MYLFFPSRSRESGKNPLLFDENQFLASSLISYLVFCEVLHVNICENVSGD